MDWFIVLNDLISTMYISIKLIITNKIVIYKVCSKYCLKFKFLFKMLLSSSHQFTLITLYMVYIHNKVEKILLLRSVICYLIWSIDAILKIKVDFKADILAFQLLTTDSINQVREKKKFVTLFRINKKCYKHFI